MISVYWFCILQLNWIHLLVLVVFLVESLRFSIIVSCHLQIVSFASSFQIWMNFITFSWLIAVAKASNTMLNKRGKSRHPCRLISGEKFHLFNIEYYVNCGFVTCGLCYVEAFSLYEVKWLFNTTLNKNSHFVEGFYHKWMLNFVKCFSFIYWDDLMIFILCFVKVVYHIDWL